MRYDRTLQSKAARTGNKSDEQARCTPLFPAVVVALIVGGVEAIGLLKDQLNLTGGVWDFIGSLNDNFSTMGFVIIGVFIFSWIGSMIVYRIKGFDRLESTTPIAD
jgi:High-affinity nickel-transport protein